jgi:proteasome lid subunit RPN8/RPN11
MLLQLTHEQAKELVKYAQANQPYEICGFVGGKDFRAELLLPITNIAEHPETQFYMEPTEMFRAYKKLEQQNLDLLAIYLSHPKSAPIPSTTDIREAEIPNVIHIIISLQNKIPALKAWQINSGKVQPAELIISNKTSPLRKPDYPLSSAQKTAIILSAILASILVILLAVQLLPPAPNLMEGLP